MKLFYPKVLAVIWSFAFFVFAHSAFAQEVGIDNTNPQYKLDINGQLHVKGKVYIGDTTGSNYYILPNTDGSTDQILQTDGNGNVTWQTVAGVNTDSQDLGYNNLNSPVSNFVEHEVTITNGNSAMIHDYYEKDSLVDGCSGCLDIGTEVTGVNTTARINGNGSSGSPLDIAQQGASSGDVLTWDGSNWVPQSSGGGGGGNGCPSGYVDAGDFCIETTRRSNQVWWIEAADSCRQDSAQLCRLDQLWASCKDGIITTYGTSGSHTNEWTSSVGNIINAATFAGGDGNGNNTNNHCNDWTDVASGDLEFENKYYRCCIEKH